MQMNKPHFLGWKFRVTLLPGIMLLAFSALSPKPSQAESIDPVKFKKALFELHQQQVKDKQLRLEETEGQYNGKAAERYRYLDTKYYEAGSARLLSHIRSDADRPEILHIIEVNIYDNAGRVVRDFGSVSLPSTPAYPARTLLNFHRYNGELHSFRQFNEFGDVTYEACEGLLEKRRLTISLDETEIKPAVTATFEYKACFYGMEARWDAYAMPH